jgi:hypothetical protein
MRTFHAVCSSRAENSYGSRLQPVVSDVSWTSGVKENPLAGRQQRGKTSLAASTWTKLRTAVRTRQSLSAGAALLLILSAVAAHSYARAVFAPATAPCVLPTGMWPRDHGFSEAVDLGESGRLQCGSIPRVRVRSGWQARASLAAFTGAGAARFRGPGGGASWRPQRRLALGRRCRRLLCQAS